MKNYDVLSDLVPRTQELHRAIFDKGYQQGFKDGADSDYERERAVAKAYNDRRTFILDRIKEEVLRLTHGDTPERIWNVDVLQIIDKYSEVKE